MLSVTSGSSQGEDLLQRIFANESKDLSWFDRSASRDALQRQGLPHAKAEAWKYTDPKKFVVASLQEAASESKLEVNGSGIELVSFEATEAKAALARRDAPLIEHQSMFMAAVNELLFNLGYVVIVSDNAHATQHLAIRGDSTSCEKLVIRVGKGSRLEIEETGTSCNRVIECIVEEGASVVHRRRQPASEYSTYGLTLVALHERSTYDFSQVTLGGSYVRNEIIINMVGEYADTELKGGWKVDLRQHLDNQICVNHLVPNCTSLQRFRGVAQGRSKSIFNGRIYIAKDAQGSNARLSNKNISESATAEVYTKPELEIYANDVVCSHGATTGQLDLTALMYMKTRGIAELKARKLLLNGFLRATVQDPQGQALLGL